MSRKYHIIGVRGSDIPDLSVHIHASSYDMTPETLWDEDTVPISSEDTKTYTVDHPFEWIYYRESMIILSKKFPEHIFTLMSESEFNPTAIQVEYYHNGKYHFAPLRPIPFDPTLLQTLEVHH